MSVSIKPRYAGQWYPAQEQKLSQMLSQYFAHSESAKPQEGSLRAIIAPHAGLMFSGQTAAYAYHQLSQAISEQDIVVLIAPSHRVRFDGIATVRKDGHINTPLGQLKFADNLSQHLPSKTFFHDEGIVQAEHAVEMHFPFLSYLNRQSPVLPMVVSPSPLPKLQQFSQELKQAMDTWEEHNEGAVYIIASTDLSHFYPAATAEQLDGHVIPMLQQAMAEKNPESFYKGIMEGKAEACGYQGVYMTLKILHDRAGSQGQSIKIAELHRSHSGQTTGDNASVVGYLAAGFYITPLKR